MKFGWKIVPKKIKFNILFSLCKQQNRVVSRVLEGREINLTFRRKFDTPQILEGEQIDGRNLKRCPASMIKTLSNGPYHCLFVQTSCIHWVLG
jgi:hypothetical protein